MLKHKLILVAGARPNFMKVAPLMRALEGHATIEPVLVHTGQHYDRDMSGLFFRQLGLPTPEIDLGVGSASHAVQTARIMESFEEACQRIQPDMVLVVGDVNSTVACTLVPAKLGIKTAHYEAGLRSFDRSMPEEINRVVTDSICDYFFTTSKDADENLCREGKAAQSIFLVGNLMIDTLHMFNGSLNGHERKLQNLITEEWLEDGALPPEGYGVITLHRPSNVDERTSLKKVLSTLCQISETIPLIFPVHPRTYKGIINNGLYTNLKQFPNLILTKPNGYLEFLQLMRSSKFVVTDSGGIQEETTVLGIPCLTLRPNTERPITMTAGTNKLVTVDELENEVRRILRGHSKRGETPPLWDGKTASRMIRILADLLN